jgi:hypothetical protein
MKAIIFIFLALFLTDPPKANNNEGCTSGTGHIYVKADSIHRGERINFIDTIQIDSAYYEQLNHVLNDSIYFTCLRCDSAKYYIIDTIKHITSDSLIIRE